MPSLELLSIHHISPTETEHAEGTQTALSIANLQKINADARASVDEVRKRLQFALDTWFAEEEPFLTALRSE